MVVVDFESLGALFDRLDLGSVKDVLMGAYDRFGTGRSRAQIAQKVLNARVGDDRLLAEQSVPQVSKNGDCHTLSHPSVKKMRFSS